MERVDAKVEGICEEVIGRNPGESEFHQAVREVVGSLGPALYKRPDYLGGANIAGFVKVARAVIVQGLA